MGVGGTFGTGDVSEVDGCEMNVSQCAHVDAIVCTLEQSRSLLKSLELPGEKLPADQSQQLTELLTKYLDVFAMCDAKLGCTDLVKHSDHGAIRQQPYRYPWCTVTELIRWLLR